ncbi:MAG TPA: acyl-CoA thioesterase II [Rhizomicrobium sp.]|jgi:acyl-CoA thioesterase-2|nr:acyl-CoA thioesterase II [Rhizomicrobium sp.]
MRENESPGERSPIEQLVALLDLEPIEENIFRGVSPKDRFQRVFGGQVLGQALVAATRTVDARVCHSLHAYFLLPGDPRVPILYEVDRSRDGSSFSSRRVVAIQHGRQIFHMSASFQVGESGLEHQIDPPDVPMPEQLPSEDEYRGKLAHSIPAKYRDHFLRKRPIEVRPVDGEAIVLGSRRPPYHAVWMRAAGALPDNTALQQCVLAYASDMTLLESSLLPHGISWFDESIQLASVDHAMWFHRPFRADEWLLYVQDSPSASGARGFNRGQVYTRAGTLVASVAQEGLVRLRGTSPASGAGISRWPSDDRRGSGSASGK